MSLHQKKNFSFQHLESDLERLEKRLKKLTTPFLQPQQHRRILDLACGRADEAQILVNTLGGQTTQIIGADIRHNEIEEAQKRWANTRHAEAEFIVQDGTRLDESQLLGGDFDFLVMRHQNYWNGERTWEQIFDQGLHQLKESGHILITSYFDREHFLADQALKRLGAELINHDFNPHGTIVRDAPGKTVDRHIALYKIAQK